VVIANAKIEKMEEARVAEVNVDFEHDLLGLEGKASGLSRK
jgi:hypothetical protein